MTGVTKEQFEDWRASHVGKAFFKMLAEMQMELKELKHSVIEAATVTNFEEMKAIAFQMVDISAKVNVLGQVISYEWEE